MGDWLIKPPRVVCCFSLSPFTLEQENKRERERQEHVQKWTARLSFPECPNQRNWQSV